MARDLIPRSDNTTPLLVKPSHWRKYLGNMEENYIVSGMTVSDGGGLVATVATGAALIEGIQVELTTSTENVNLVDDATNYVFAQITEDVDGEPDTWAFVVNQTGTPPSDSVLIAKIVVASGSISSIDQTTTSSVYTKYRPSHMAIYNGSTRIFETTSSGVHIPVVLSAINFGSFTHTNFVASSPTFSGTTVFADLANSANSLFERSTNGVASLAVNYIGYLGGITQFRNFDVYDGKNAPVFGIVGSTKLATFFGDVSIGANKIKTSSVDYLSRASGHINLETTAATTSNEFSIWGTVTTATNLNARLIVAGKGQPDVSGVFEHLRIDGYYEDSFVINVVQGSSALRPLKLQMGGNDIITLGAGNTIDLHSRAVSNLILGNLLNANDKDIAGIKTLIFGQGTGTSYYLVARQTGNFAIMTYNAGDIERLRFGSNAAQGSSLITSFEPFQFEKYLDLKVITAPADPSAGYSRLYSKAIDASNDGIFAKIKKSGSFAELPMIPAFPELGRVVLGSAGTALTLSGLTPKKHMVFIIAIEANTTNSVFSADVRFNSDSGTNYYERLSVDGGADGTGSGDTKIDVMTISTGSVAGSRMYIAIRVDNNSAGKRKNASLYAIGNIAGAGIPNRTEGAIQWSNVTEQIDEINIVTNVNMAVGSEVIALGSD